MRSKVNFFCQVYNVMYKMKWSKEYFQRISNLLIRYLRKKENTVSVVIEDEVCGYIRKNR